MSSVLVRSGVGNLNVVIICIFIFLLHHPSSGFNVNIDDASEHIFMEKTPESKYGETPVEQEGASYFGYQTFIQLIQNEIDWSIEVAISAPRKMLLTYRTSDNEEGGNIKEPTPQKRAALSSTTAMGALYYCDMLQSQLLNTSSNRIHNCSMRADVDRALSGFEISNRDALGLSLVTSPLTTKGHTISEMNTIVTCAPLRLHDCTTNYKAEGACYVSETVPGRGDSHMVTQWRKRIPCRDSCFEQDIDLMFVIDGSYSVENDSFQMVKGWVKAVTNGFDIDSQVQVGVVQYSYYYPNRIVQKYMKTEISLGEYKNKTLFDEAVDKIKYQGYSTYTAHAIKKTVNEDFKGPTSRYPDARRVMILLTDGFADDADDLSLATKYAAASGVESFAVGVGDYVLSQLKLIAGDNVITVNNFEDLNNIISELHREIQIMEGEIMQMRE